MNKIACIIIISLFAISSCQKKAAPDCPVFTGRKLPYTFYFVLKQNNQRLPDSILNNLKLYFQNGSTKTYITDFGRAGSGGYNLGAMITLDIAFKSADYNIKNYYLEFPGNDIDTLFVDYRHYFPCEADTSACYCLFPRLAVKYNGHFAPFDPSITQQLVYLFTKP